ncbi:MAG: helix-turn-helix domain-containing protein [Clostridia bacterium]|nr:helix-turn-helix domain-containing protein [Clostridia bacterium]
MITMNILPEGFKPLPVVFHSASAYHRQKTAEYKGNMQDFYQILMVVGGEGTLYFKGDKYKLEKGSAFFTAMYQESTYVDEGNLITAFLTVTGEALPSLFKHYECEEFKFFESVNIEKYVSKIQEIINEYYKTKNERCLSVLSYSFYMSFFEDGQEENKNADKTDLYIEKNFHKKLTLDEIAKINQTSVSKLCHDFKAKYGYTIFQHIINLRLNYADNLLSSASKIKIKDVAAECGFDDVSYFCRLYKKKFGKSPLENK